MLALGVRGWCDEEDDDDASRRHHERRLRTVIDELRGVVDDFPFDENDADKQPYAIFCLDDATRDELLAAADPLDPDADPVAPGVGVVYWNPRKGTTVDTAFAKVIARATFKARTTNRNLRTLVKILG